MDSPPLEDEHAKVYKHVTGKFVHVQEDFYEAQFVIKELARHLRAPTQLSLARLKHCVRFLKGRTDQVRALVTDGSAGEIEIFVGYNWTACVKTGRITDCVVSTLFGAHLGSSVKTQTPIEHSSAEAELGGCHRGGVQACYIQNLWCEAYTQLLNITVRTDSSAGKIIATRRGVGRVRHL